MKKTKLFLNIFCMAAIPCFAGIEPKAQKQFIQDLTVIESVFDKKYAPTPWKKEHLDWELSAAILEAKKAIRQSSNPSIKDFQRVARTFFQSPKDYHVSVGFYSTEISLLPFRLRESNSRYFIEWIDENTLAAFKKQGTSAPIQVGDEVLSYNGTPIKEVMESFFQKEFGENLKDTDIAMGTASFTFRTGAQGFLADEEGAALFSLRRGANNQNYQVSVPWFHLPEEVLTPFPGILRDFEIGQYENNFNSNRAPLAEHPKFKTLSVNPQYKYQEVARNILARRGSEMIEGLKPDIHGYGVPVGNRDTFLPDLGNVTWRTPEDFPFEAYIFVNSKGKRIGFLRLPTFMAEEGIPMQLLELINIFEQHTSALVIDQTRNPGGLLFYKYAIACMLANRPMTPPRLHHALSQEDVDFALRNIKELQNIQTDEQAKQAIGTDMISGLPVTAQFVSGLLAYSQDILNAWQKGTLYTEPLVFFGIDKLNPHPRGHYTKPILMLIDELDFSCGDFLPAILQDNKRAVLMGNTTSGAGGSVIQHTFPNRLGIAKFSFTNTLAKRLNGQPIENLGVSPDVPYNITPEDLQNGYQGYKAKILDVLNTML
jgi:hypothetical protein